MGVGTVCEEPVCDNANESSWSHLVDSSGSCFVDDISGKVLDPKLVYAARRDEIKGANNHRVWDKVPTK